MDLKEYAVMIIDKAERAVADKDTNEAIRILMLLNEVIVEQCRKLATGKTQ